MRARSSRRSVQSASMRLLIAWMLLAIMGRSPSAWSQDPILPVPAPALPAGDSAETVNQPAIVTPAVGMAEAGQPANPPVTMSVLDAALESLFGDVYAPGSWRPISFRTFFTEGWNEAWAGGPAGRDGLTPRHGWLGSFDGVFYRLAFTTFAYQNNVNTAFGGNSYIANTTLFLPFSRRFEVRFDTPWVVANGTTNPRKGYTSQFGDFTVTPRFMLKETEATTQVFALGVRTPTGTRTTGNDVMSLTPEYQFWTNPGGPWVVRGQTGVTVPLNTGTTPGQTTFNGGLDVGRYFTPHDVPFGDLVFYVATNYSVPLSGNASHTYVSVGPGTRFHITNNWFFLSFLEVPVTGPHTFTYSSQFALMKVF